MDTSCIVHAFPSVLSLSRRRAAFIIGEPGRMFLVQVAVRLFSGIHVADKNTKFFATRLNLYETNGTLNLNADLPGFRIGIHHIEEGDVGGAGIVSPA
eukprot:2370439-Pleurochrysis_carterae.AAC.3